MFDLKFYEALQLLEDGEKVAREGWNGKGMWIKKVSISHPISTGMNESFELNSFLVIKNASGKLDTWVASISDTFAEDWDIVN